MRDVDDAALRLLLLLLRPRDRNRRERGEHGKNRESFHDGLHDERRLPRSCRSMQWDADITSRSRSGTRMMRLSGV